MIKKGNKEGSKSTRAGVENKSTSIVRDAFQSLVESNLNQIEKDLQELEPKDRIKIVLELASFILPKLRLMELNANVNDKINIPIVSFFGLDGSINDNEDVNNAIFAKDLLHVPKND